MIAAGATAAHENNIARQLAFCVRSSDSPARKQSGWEHQLFTVRRSGFANLHCELQRLAPVRYSALLTAISLPRPVWNIRSSDRADATYFRSKE